MQEKIKGRMKEKGGIKENEREKVERNNGS
jgi:hypothetical protein